MFGNTSPSSTADPMYAIPRPRSRADCKGHVGPCPWVGCRHHLLIEVLTGSRKRKAKRPRKTSIVINQAARGRSGLGRRKGLRSSAELLVRAWIDEAIEQLFRMPYTCALDVVERFPDGLSQRETGWLFGISEQAIHEEEKKPEVREAAEQLREYLTDEDQGDDEG